MAELYSEVDIVFARLRQYNLHVNPTKIKIGFEQMDVFGFLVQQHSITIHPSRLNAIRDLDYPKDKKSLFSVHGTMNYFRSLIPSYAKLAKPISEMMSQKKPFILQ